MNEVWKDISGYEGFYQVSNLGRVRRLTVLKTSHKYDKYLKVDLSKESKVKTFRIHKLVANAFLNKINNDLVVNHKDGNKRNNRLDNLEYVTQSENVKHSLRNGLSKEFGETHSRAKLTEKIVLEMRSLHKNGMSVSKIADTYHMSYNTTLDAVRKKTWKHI